MNPHFQNRVFPYAPCAEQQPGCNAMARPVVIVGAGMAFLAVGAAAGQITPARRLSAISDAHAISAPGA